MVVVVFPATICELVEGGDEELLFDWALEGPFFSAITLSGGRAKPMANRN